MRLKAEGDCGGSGHLPSRQSIDPGFNFESCRGQRHIFRAALLQKLDWFHPTFCLERYFAEMRPPLR